MKKWLLILFLIPSLAYGANETWRNNTRISRNVTTPTWTFDVQDANLTPEWSNIQNKTVVLTTANNTSHLSEGANLYYTDERVDDRAATLIQNGANFTWVYDDTANTFTGGVTAGVFQPLDSDLTDLADGTLTASKVGGVADADYGDIVVSSGAWAVEDDSHAHTSTSVSGIDVSADTNLTAGDALTLTDDDLDFDGGASPGGELGGTWASPTLDDNSSIQSIVIQNNSVAVGVNSLINFLPGSGIDLAITNDTYGVNVTIGSSIGGGNVSQAGAVANTYFPVWTGTGTVGNSTYTTTDAVNWNTAYNNYHNKSIVADDDDSTKGIATFNDTHFDVTTGLVKIASDAIKAAELDVTDVSDDIAADIAEGELADSVIVSADIKNGEVTAADTAITAGRSLTWSTNDVAADAELFTDTKCIYIENITATDDLPSIWIAKQAATITNMWGESDQTVVWNFLVDDGSPALVNATNLTMAAGVVNQDSPSGDATLAAGDRLDLTVDSVSGTPTRATCCVTFTYDD